MHSGKSSQDTPITTVSLEDQKRLMAGRVRDGFIEEGLSVVCNSRVFKDVVHVAARTQFLGFHARGVYLNKRLLSEFDDETRDQYSSLFTHLSNEYGVQSERVVVLPEGASDETVRHELAHDVFCSQPLDKRRELALLVMGFDGDSELDDLCYNMWGVGGMAPAGGVDVNVAALNEFAGSFFSGQREGREKEAYYVRDRAPQSLRDMFFDLGFIWPK